MTVRQKDTAKTDVMTATENIVMRGIVDDPQGSARTILMAQMEVEMEGWASNLQLMYIRSDKIRNILFFFRFFPLFILFYFIYVQSSTC